MMRPARAKPTLQLALQHRRRAELRADDELHRLPQQLVAVVVVGRAGHDVVTQVDHHLLAAAPRFDGDALLVDDLGLLATPRGDDRAHLVLADPRALDAVAARTTRA